MQLDKSIFWISTSLLSLLMIFSASMYFLKTQMISSIFISMGYNERIVIPLAILKIAGVVAIVSNYSRTLKLWAYFGFLMDFSLALEGHLSIKDGGHTMSIIALILWIVSYTYDRKVRKASEPIL